MTTTAALLGRHKANASTENGIQAASARYASVPGTARVYTSESARASSRSTPASLAQLAWHGSAITVLGQIASAAIRFGANLVITRLLLPEQFGLMALITVFLVGLHLFSDIGIGPSIIQSPRGEQQVFLDTAWTVQAVRGTMLWLAACLLGWPLARFYGQPELVVLLPVAGLTALLGGLESTKLHVQSRRLSMLPVTLVDLVAQVASVLVMIGVALVWRSIWALVISGIASAFFRTVLSHAVLPGPGNRFAWDADSWRAMFAFGRWIFLSTALTFLATQSDRLLLGKLVTAGQLGLYAIAASLASMPLQVVQKLGQAVFFPVVATAMRQPGHNTRAIRDSHRKLLLALVPAVALGVAAAPAVVHLLYRPAYHAVGQLTTLLSIGTWLSIISTSYGVVLLAAGRPRYLSMGLALKLVLMAVLVWLAAPRYGVAGVALIVSLSELGTLVVNLVACRQLGAVTLAADVGVTIAGAVLVGGYLLTHALVLRVTGSPLVALAGVATLGLGATAFLLRRLGVA